MTTAKLLRPRSFEHVRVPRIDTYGHSLPVGAGASDPYRDIMSHVCHTLGAREFTKAVGGSIGAWHQGGGTGDGGYAHMWQTDLRKTRVGTTLSAQGTAGATTITVASATGLVIGDLLMVGIGDTGASGGECVWITGIAGNVLTIKRRDLSAGGLLRTHANGQPVWQVPSEYINLKPCYVIWWGLNDLAAYPLTSDTLLGGGATNYRARYVEMMRANIAHARCSDRFQQDHVSNRYTGTWGSHSPSTASNYGATIRQPTLPNAFVEVDVPDNFRSGGEPQAVNLFFVTTPGITVPPVWTISVDGVVHGTLTCYDNYGGKNRGTVYRIPSEDLAPGRHVIKAELTTLGVGGTYYNGWGVESPNPPIVLVPGFNRPFGYELWPSWNNSRRTTTLTGTHGVGTTSWTVASTTGMTPGQTVTFEEGLAGAETLEVATVPTGTTFTTTTASATSHAGGVGVVYGMQDADIPKCNRILGDLLAEFDDNGQFVDIDAVIQKDPLLFWHDGAHYSDAAHAKLSEAFIDALWRCRGLTLKQMSYTAAPAVPLPCNLTFLTAGVTAANTTWTIPQSSTTELFATTINRIMADLRQAKEMKFCGHVRTAFHAAAVLAIQYTLDLTGAAGWKFITRQASYAEGTGLEIPVGTTGFKVSAWEDIAAEALVEQVLLRIVGLKATGNIAGAAGGLYVQVR